MDGNHQALSMMTPLSYSNEPLHQEVNAQITPNYHNMSYPDAGYTVPTQAISPVIPGRDDEVPLPYPAPSQGHLGPLSGDAGAVVTTGSSVTALCPLRDGQGGICRTLLGYHCQDHLASAHGIHNMSGRTPVRCDACNSTVNRESIVRHIREVHLGFPRKKPCEVKDRNAKAHEVAAYKAKRGVKARK
ncbi:hypothetical protein EDC04DRAFT_2741379 [Pisolithus marmoratus]|nr:hypothetical protein EDC04DRAFT_2741379 [Pisolithus marmoratus]